MVVKKAQSTKQDQYSGEQPDEDGQQPEVQQDTGVRVSHRIFPRVDCDSDADDEESNDEESDDEESDDEKRNHEPEATGRRESIDKDQDAFNDAQTRQTGQQMATHGHENQGDEEEENQGIGCSGLGLLHIDEDEEDSSDEEYTTEDDETYSSGALSPPDKSFREKENKRVEEALDQENWETESMFDNKSDDEQSNDEENGNINTNGHPAGRESDSMVPQSSVDIRQSIAEGYQQSQWAVPDWKPSQIPMDDALLKFELRQTVRIMLASLRLKEEEKDRKENPELYQEGENAVSNEGSPDSEQVEATEDDLSKRKQKKEKQQETKQQEDTQKHEKIRNEIRRRLEEQKHKQKQEDKDKDKLKEDISQGNGHHASQDVQELMAILHPGQGDEQGPCVEDQPQVEHRSKSDYPYFQRRRNGKFLNEDEEEE